MKLANFTDQEGLPM